MRNRINQIIEELEKIRNELDGNNGTKEFKPSEKMLERWKKTKPTKKTLDLLKSKGLSEEQIEEVKTQYECHVILNNLNKENERI